MNHAIYSLKKVALTTLTFTLCLSLQAQQSISGSFSSNGQTRSYLGAVPNNPQSSMRLVILFCGAQEDATEMTNRGYNNFLGNNSMVIYPEPSSPVGFDNNPAVDDFQMVEDLITEINSNYSINLNDICIGGFSNGAIFSYKLVCDFNATGSSRAYSFKSFAIVSGAMEDGKANLTDCPVASEVPLIAFHGTQDPIINVNGGFLFPPINLMYQALSTSLQFWTEDINGCGPNPVVTPLADVVNEVPNSTVQLNEYACSSSPNTKFYNVLGGSHSWPGGNANIDNAQSANRDINASELIAEFFENASSVSTVEYVLDPQTISTYPNPVNGTLTIESIYPIRQVEIFNTTGIRIAEYANGFQSINLEHLTTGIYYVKVHTYQGVGTKKIIKN